MAAGRRARGRRATAGTVPVSVSPPAMSVSLYPIAFDFGPARTRGMLDTGGAFWPNPLLTDPDLLVLWGCEADGQNPTARCPPAVGAGRRP